jgi:hypothetical protein
MGSKTLRPSGGNDCVISCFVHSLVLTEGGGARGPWIETSGPRLQTDRRQLDYTPLPGECKPDLSPQSPAVLLAKPANTVAFRMLDGAKPHPPRTFKLAGVLTLVARQQGKKPTRLVGGICLWHGRG